VSAILQFIYYGRTRVDRLLASVLVCIYCGMCADGCFYAQWITCCLHQMLHHMWYLGHLRTCLVSVMFEKHCVVKFSHLILPTSVYFTVSTNLEIRQNLEGQINFKKFMVRVCHRNVRDKFMMGIVWLFCTASGALWVLSTFTNLKRELFIYCPVEFCLAVSKASLFHVQKIPFGGVHGQVK